MGFSVTGSHVIFFVAAVIVAGAVSGLFVAVTMNLTGSFSEKADRLKDQFDTEFSIINDPREIPESEGYYIFYIKNIGTNRLITSNETCQVFIDGMIVDSSGFWFENESIYPDQYVELYVDSNSIATGFHTIRIVGQSACEDDLVFEIT